MSIEVGIWRIDEGANPVFLTGMDLEKRLEDVIANDISILDDQLMVIGRQVSTSYGTSIDLLAIDEEGDLIVIELKRDKTPRDIVAQALDYGSWAHRLTTAEIEATFADFQDSTDNAPAPESLADAMKHRFKGVPEEFNARHRLLIVASTLDPRTERIVDYLREVHRVDINVALFQAFTDAEKQYIVRAWFSENKRLSSDDDIEASAEAEWNGEWFVNVGEGEHRTWGDARRYGFISAGGAPRFEKAMKRLQVGDTIWAYVSRHGYVGCGEVHTEATRGDDFVVSLDGIDKPISECEIEAGRTFEEGHEEWYVGVDWITAVPRDEAVFENNRMYWHRGVSARPKAPAWQETIDSLRERWGIEEDSTTTPDHESPASPSDPTSESCR